MSLPDIPNADESKRGELVPVTEQRKKEPKDFPKIDEFLNNIADYAQGYKQKDKMERLRTIVKMRNYCLGNQIGIVNESGVWLNKKQEGDGLYFDPQLATFIEVLVSQIVKSRPIYKCRARAEHEVSKREGAKCAEELIKQAQSKLLTAKKLQKEVKWNLLLAGETYRYTFFDPNKDGYGIPEPVYQNKGLKPKNKPTWVCPICTKNGEVEQAYEPTATEGDITDTKQADSICPDCGVRADVISPKEANIPIRDKYQYKRVGDVDCDFPDALEMTVIGADDSIADALVVQRDRLIPRCVLEMMFPEVELPSTTVPTHLEYKEALKGKMGDGEDLSGKEQFEMLHFQETWVAPATYHNYVFKEDTKLVNGEMIPRGTEACNLFERGCYFARVGKQLVNIYEQAIGDCWSHTVNSIGSDFHGIGEWDLIELQDQKNEMRSMQLNSALLDSTSPIMFRSQYTDGSKFPNKFGALVPIKDAPNELALDNIARRVEPSRGAPEAHVLDDKLAGSMQQRVGAFSTQGDAPDIKALGTATGMALMNEHTIGRRSPMLQLRTEMEIEQAYQILELRQKHWPEQMYKGVEKDIGGDAVRWFRELDIRGDIEIEVLQDSWMPKTDAQKRMDFREHIELITPALQLKPELIDKFVEQAAELYEGGNLDDVVSDETEAETRLETLFKVVEFVESQGLPVTDMEGNPLPQAVMAVLGNVAKMVKIVSLPSDPMAGAPLDVLLDRHTSFCEVYSEWLKSSEGRDASQFTRACVRNLYELHIQADTMQKQKLLQNEMAAQAPMMQAQAEAEMAQGQQQAEAQSQANQEQAQLQQQQAETDQAAREDEAEREIFSRVSESEEREAEREESERQRQHEREGREHDLKMKDKEIEAKRIDAKKNVSRAPKR